MLLRLCFYFLLTSSVIVNAQEPCNVYFPYNEGTSLSYKSYDKKGKLSQTETQKVVSLTETGEGMDATLKVMIRDKKDKEVMNTSYDIQCKDGVLYFDVRTMFNEEMLAPLQSMEFTVEGEELAFPPHLKVGERLEDGSVKIKSSGGGINIMNMEVNVTNRKVLGKETITTPAGTFECFKVSQDMDMKYIIRSSFSSVEYYAEGVGNVKSESYNSKGKLIGTRELVAIERD